MNHRKKSQGIRKHHKRSTLMIRIFPYRKKSRRTLRTRKPNHWHMVSENVFSKNVIRDVELLWLHEHAPTATITFEKVANCETMPLYKSGKWNGMAYFVRFQDSGNGESLAFRIHWWNHRV